MAPRTRRQGAGAPAAATGPAPTFAEVPIDVLQHILGLLDIPDRQRASLVCRRWYDCVHSGELCRHVSLGGADRSDPSCGTFDSLTCWLRRHGQHLRSLQLMMGNSGLMYDPDRSVLLGCCLATAAAAGRLERLLLRSPAGLLLSAAWMQPLRRLRELSLQAAPDGLLINTTLEHHTQLTALSMRAAPLVFRAGVQLPPSLLRLELSDRSYEELPSQLSPLTRLSALRLTHGTWASDGYAVLKQLPALRHLVLHSNLHMPECLKELTQIEALVLSDELPVFLRLGPPAAVNAAINAGLQPLTQLTSLYIGTHAWQGGLPAVAGLSRLQRLCLDDGGPPSLPAGPWIGRLRELGTSWACLCSSTQALAAAAQLQHVAVLERSDANSVRANRAFFAWAAAHASLRSLHFYLQGDMPKGLRTAVGRLQKQRPELAVQHTSLPDVGGLQVCPFAASFDPQPFV